MAAPPPAVPLHSSLPAPLLLSKKRRWTIKHALSTRHSHESNNDPSFFLHSKSLFICSWSGRPIYTRYGDDSKLAGYMGVITALIENFKRINNNQSINYIKAGVYMIVFSINGPLYSIIVSRTGESISSLQLQLEYANQQILSVLTCQVKSILEQRPQFDVRNLMTGTENLLTDLLQSFDSGYDALLDAVHFMRLPRALRTKIRTALKKCLKHCMYGLLLNSGHQLIDVCCSKTAKLYSQDLHLLMNFLYNSQSLQSSEAWTPICLPRFNDTGYVYVYVAYLTEFISLALVTVNSQDFAQLREAKNAILDTLIKKHCLEEIIVHSYESQPNMSKKSLASANPSITSLSRSGNSIDDLSQSTSTSLSIKNDSVLNFVAGVNYTTCATENAFIELSDIDELTSLSEILHFVYRHELTQQSLQSTSAPPFHSTKQRRGLFRAYQRAWERAGCVQQQHVPIGTPNTDPNHGAVPLVWMVGKVCNVLVIVKPGDCSIACAFLTGVEKSTAFIIANKILKWIKREEGNLIFT